TAAILAEIICIVGADRQMRPISGLADHGPVRPDYRTVHAWRIVPEPVEFYQRLGHAVPFSYKRQLTTLLIQRIIFRVVETLHHRVHLVLSRTHPKHQRLYQRITVLTGGLDHQRSAVL